MVLMKKRTPSKMLTLELKIPVTEAEIARYKKLGYHIVTQPSATENKTLGHCGRYYCNCSDKCEAEASKP